MSIVLNTCARFSICICKSMNLCVYKPELCSYIDLLLGMCAPNIAKTYSKQRLAIQTIDRACCRWSKRSND